MDWIKDIAPWVIGMVAIVVSGCIITIVIAVILNGITIGKTRYPGILNRRKGKYERKTDILHISQVDNLKMRIEKIVKEREWLRIRKYEAMIKQEDLLVNKTHQIAKEMARDFIKRFNIEVNTEIHINDTEEFKHCLFILDEMDKKNKPIMHDLWKKNGIDKINGDAWVKWKDEWNNTIWNNIVEIFEDKYDDKITNVDIEKVRPLIYEVAPQVGKVFKKFFEDIKLISIEYNDNIRAKQKELDELRFSEEDK